MWVVRSKAGLLDSTNNCLFVGFSNILEYLVFLAFSDELIDIISENWLLQLDTFEEILSLP